MKNFFTPEEEKKIVSAIGEAESKTSAEIRVHIARRCSGSPYDEAIKVFERLGMTKTAERNGVLIYLDLRHHRFAVIGDIGIHQKLPPNFWEKVRDAMQEDFKKGEFVQGLINGIRSCGDQLGQHFPRKRDDQNELLNEISRG